jgi:hypothetical protein
LLYVLKVPPSGFSPSRWFQPYSPWEELYSSNTCGLLPFRALFLPDGCNLITRAQSAHALQSATEIAAQSPNVNTIWKAVSHAEGLGHHETHALLGFWPLRLSPLQSPVKILRSFSLPLSSLLSIRLATRASRDLRGFRLCGSASPSMRAPACLAFVTGCHTPNI